ncbi:DUF1501 domain-containing protein [Membranihabitans marinus]|uniref:DUF1501 domain-containing protein n=1 Tax=Membranihabitans marinus TaxID=1227546 RepID=UPI001F37622C|nr:DUF1501 domain-containing protein [Membranihabitans marinus]
MKRRKFIKNMSALYLPVTMGIPGLSFSNIAPIIENNPDKTLIIIQLIGGYDGLSAFIPLDQYSNLQSVRSNILPTEKSLLKVGDKNAFHPALSGFQKLFNEGKMTVVQNVGYPLQNRSHFRSTDIWNSASGSTEYLNSGWLGRYSDIYNNVETDYPWAISIGNNVSETCQGETSNHAISLLDPSKPITLPYGEVNELGNGSFADNMNYILETISANNKYGTILESTFNKGNSLSTLYPDNNSLAQQFKTIAQLLSGGLKTPILTVSLGGFDTHANQVSNSDNTQGTLPQLLQTLGDALYAFWDDLSLLGLENKVMAMTYSEFGRKIRSNASLGTDHGDAAPMFLFGNCLNQQIIGSNPIIHPDVSQRDGIPFEIDYRNVYGSILSDYFPYTESDTLALFPQHDFQKLDITTSCETITSNSQNFDTSSITVFPQPTRNYLVVQMTVMSTNTLQLILRDDGGKQIKQWKFNTRGKTKFEETLHFNGLVTGMYFLEFKTESKRVQKKIIIQA